MQRPRGMREHGVLTEMQSLGWLQCGVPWGCGGAAEDEAGEARFRAVEHLLYPHHLPAHPFISVTGAKKDFHPPNSLFPALSSFGI